MRGMGRVFKRTNSEHWWIAYCHRGREVRETSRSSDRRVAERLLRRRLQELGADRLGLRQFAGPAQERLTLDDLSQDYLRDYEVNRRPSKFAAEARVTHLKAFFAETRAVDITTEAIRRYMAHRQGEKAAAGTINRELTSLGRMFRLACRAGRLNTVPHIPKLAEPPPRAGFFEHGEYLAIREHLPTDYQDVLDFGYHSGWRRGEILRLEWRDVDRARKVIRLRHELSKTREGRLLVLAGPLAEVIERRWHGRVLGCPFVFHVRGQRIVDWRKTWVRACTAAKLPGKLFHDLRRTVVRNLVRAGVPERVAMGITGHRTRSVFDRYDITSEADVREGLATLNSATGTNRGDKTPNASGHANKQSA
jgi:integrase